MRNQAISDEIDPLQLFGIHLSILKADGIVFMESKINSIKDRLNAHEKWLKTAGKEGARFHAKNEDFSGFDFMHRDLSRAEFVQCKFISSTFYDATLNEARFFDCAFENSIFIHAHITNTTLAITKLSGCNFFKASINSCMVTSGQANFESKNIDAQNNNFSWAEISASNFSGLNFYGSSFANTMCNGANFYDCQIRSGDFTHMTSTTPNIFNTCILNDVNFSEAALGASKFTNCLLMHSHFTGTLARGLILENSDISFSDFSTVQMPDAKLSVTAQQVNFQNSDISNAEFRLSNLRFADFRNCSLYNSDLSSSDLLAAKIDDTTNINMVNFSYCVWIDGRRCAVDSIGVCNYGN